MNTIKDVSKITNIPYKYLDRLMLNLERCVCHSTLENYNDKNCITECNIGIGTIVIGISEDEIQYKFIPSHSFETMLVNTIENKQSPLINAAEELLDTKIKQVYKELL